MLRLAPKSRVTPELRERARDCKRELLTYLRARQVARWCQDNRIDVTVGATILEVEEQALALGWNCERLWNSCFWPHSVENPRGLASLLSPGDELSGVTGDFIVISKADGQQQRFMRLE
jgi:hypothetical protein